MRPYILDRSCRGEDNLALNKKARERLPPPGFFHSIIESIVNMGTEAC